MNSLERVQKSIRGERIDRIPCFPISIASSCEILGVKQRDYSLDPDIMADTLLQFREKAGFDGIYVSRDNWVYHQALGGSMIFPENDEPYSKETILSNIKDFQKLTVPDPWDTPGMNTLLRAAEKVVREAGSDYYIQANIDTGPFSLAGVIVGLEKFLMDLMTEDEGYIQEFLAFCTDVVISYAKAMMETGVHGIQFGDASASLVGKDLFAQFVLPWEKKVGEACSSHDCDLWIHICGKTDQFLSLLNQIDFQGFEVDAKVPMTLARELLDNRIAIKGNLDTTFLLRESPEAVYAASKDIIQSGGFSTGIIGSPGCGVPRMTPLENLIAMQRAFEDSPG